MSTKYPSRASAKLPLWQGRLGEPEGERLFHLIRPFDQESKAFFSGSKGFVFLGFCCDEGIRRNQGRIGAALAPVEIRKALGNVCVHEALERTAILDGGDIVCSLAGELQGYQLELAARVEEVIKAGFTPIVLGGGHETAFGHYLGLEKTYGSSLCIINIDAHFDLRPYKEGMESSGTPFTQIAAHCKAKGWDFNYAVLGVQKIANGRNLFTAAEQLEVSYVSAAQCFSQPGLCLEKVKEHLAQSSFVYLTICLDAFSSSIAPGVSAPQPLGIFPHMILDTLSYIAKSGKLVGFDVVELSPPFDRDHQTAKLAASLIWQVLCEAAG